MKWTHGQLCTVIKFNTRCHINKSAQRAMCYEGKYNGVAPTVLLPSYTYMSGLMTGRSTLQSRK